MKKITPILQSIILSVAVFTSRTVIASDQESVADALNWKVAPTCDKKNNLCGGYYVDPPIIKNTPKPAPYQTVPVQITAKGPIIFRTNGTSILQDHVVLQQPGRLITADKATIYRNKKTGAISDIQLAGHVHVQQFGKLLIGDFADYNVEKKTLTVNDAIYRITDADQTPSIVAPLEAWGKAKEINNAQVGITDFTDVSYTTCGPIDPAWQLSAKSLRIDRNKKKGTARNVVIRIKKVPVFYTPYLSFPLSMERKSGFLIPTVGFSNKQGFDIAQPYYWNIAPNYDLVTTPHLYSARGVALENNFRYLTATSNGFLYASFLPDDQKFETFKTNTLNSYTNITPSATLQPYLTELNNDSNSRGFFEFNNQTQFNHEWSSKVDVRYLTDSYYVEDFQTNNLMQNTNQIPSFGELDYQGEHWTNTFLIQGYQTLFPIDQFQTPAQAQYVRLPEWDFGATYPQIMKDVNFNLSGQAVNFYYHSAYSPFTYQMPIGQRLHLAPSFSMPFNWASFYITPQLTADSTNYFAELATTDATTPRPTYDANRTLPLFDIDSGWYLDRTMTFGNSSFIQTLEPRLFYLYVPYENQNAYPNFDTQLLPFSVSNLYSLNEFTGFDRVQNANQLTIGLTSHILRQSDASNILTAQLGVIDYFEHQKVCLNPTTCSTTNAPLSPITGSLTWNPNALWAVTTQAAWDVSIGQMNNAQVGAQYHFENRHLLIFNYQFTHGDPNTPYDSFGYSTNASLLTLGLVWPLAGRWDAFGYTNYDLTHTHGVTQYAGLSYDTCCWALRFVASEVYNGNTQVEGGQVAENPYTTGYYIQFLLKGISAVGNRSADSMLTTTLPGFHDAFSK